MLRERISEESVDRILQALGTDHIPYDLDKSALIRCLELCVRTYREALRFKQSRIERAEFDELAKSRKAAKRLQQLISNSGVGDWTVRVYGKEVPYNDIAKQLVRDIDSELDKPRDLEKAYARSFSKHSPFDWLAGVYLPDVYELNFSKAPSISENGPYVRFAEAALQELNVTKGDGTAYKPATISRSLRHVRAGQSRRKVLEGGEFVHWTLGRLCEAYGEHSPPLAPELQENDNIVVKIVDLDAVMKFFSKHPAVVVQMHRWADEYIAKGAIPPGVSVVDLIEPDE